MADLNHSFDASFAGIAGDELSRWLSGGAYTPPFTGPAWSAHEATAALAQLNAAAARFHGDGVLPGRAWPTPPDMGALLVHRY